MKLWTVVLTAVLALGSLDADAARRLGGGGSIGRQSSNVTQRQNLPPTQPSAPANAAQRNQAQQPGAPGAAAAQAAPRRPWGAMLGGLAAGLGLAWLASALGLGPMFANLLLVLIIALAVMLVVGLILRRRRSASAQPGGYAWQAAGAGPAGPVLTPRQYNPEKVGNDASARPWERTTGAEPLEPQRPSGGSGLRIGSGLEGPQGWGTPPGFDTDGFLQAAKRNFVTLQQAWDRGDLGTLRGMMTDEMLAEIRKQLASRDTAASYDTEVVMLEAQLLGIEDTGSEYLASVEFSGMIREEASAGPAPFREVWNMAKPKDGSQGWLVAGVQALQ